MPEHEEPYQTQYRHPHFSWSEHANELLRNPTPPKEADHTDASGEYDEQAHNEALQRHDEAIRGMTSEDGLSWAEVQALQHTAEAVVTEAHNENNAIDNMSEAQRTKYLAEMREQNDLSTFNRIREQIMLEQTVLGLSETTKQIAEKKEAVSIEKALDSDTIAMAYNTGELPPVAFMSRQQDGDTRMAIIDGRVPSTFKSSSGETLPLFEARSHLEDGNTKIRVYIHSRYDASSSKSPDDGFKLNVLSFPPEGVGRPDFSDNVATLKAVMDNREEKAEEWMRGL